jgi:hypothetical protein
VLTSTEIMDIIKKIEGPKLEYLSDSEVFPYDDLEEYQNEDFLDDIRSILGI